MVKTVLSHFEIIIISNKSEKGRKEWLSLLQCNFFLYAHIICLTAGLDFVPKSLASRWNCALEKNSNVLFALAFCRKQQPFWYFCHCSSVCKDSEFLCQWKRCRLNSIPCLIICLHCLLFLEASLMRLHCSFPAVKLRTKALSLLSCDRAPWVFLGGFKSKNEEVKNWSKFPFPGYF